MTGDQRPLDISEQLTQRLDVDRASQQTQAALQSLIELAELGSYTIEVATNTIIKSPRVAQWYGLPEITTVAASVGAVAEGDRPWVSQVLAAALEPDSNGTYQVEYAVINQQTGHTYILRTNGQVQKDSAGQPLRIDGAVVDITAQRALQLALEQQIKLRTEELATANQELRTKNEEYAAINAQLTESNTLLARSNENLQQFAYVASHDLQEPLRKIQQFGDLLKTHFTGTSGQEVAYMERMQSAAVRMSVLIKDLLNYSKISAQRETNTSVALNVVINDVLVDLELLGAETNARIEVDPLPVIDGDARQLGQLFQNLLSNALKFRRPEVAPHIQIKSSRVAADQLPQGVKPVRESQFYYRIEVMDNGVGFDEKYVNRIFQVFQRLHGKSEYAGTGIGLAICEKVATNHGGAITARSQPGQGATFTIYLPV
ncbi:MAG: hypothetical protein EOO39_28600 [Cytophagaceae bacterium]|nr:MAG: hypothetical protein EOO39_28600 [Cytophagaceae bacterium]